MSKSLAELDREYRERPVRVTVPILVSLESESFTVREFTLNLSEGGIFLITEKTCAPGVTGSLTFRATQFDEPFRLKGEVVRSSGSGLGIRFLDLTDRNVKRLRSLIEGVTSGSVVQKIRESLSAGGRNPENELRSRPISQKLMFAISANESEIRALIRDANPVVLLRLLDNPRVHAQHAAEILRNRGLPTQVVSAIHSETKWISNEAVRWTFCTHPAAMLKDVMREMTRLPRGRIERLSTDRTVRPPVRMKAEEMVKKR